MLPGADQNPADRPRESAHSYALRLLTARSHAIRELTRKLARRGYGEEESNGTIARLESSGLLDDARYAEQYARSRIVNDSASPRRVVQLLVRHGVDRRVAEDAVGRVVQDEQLDPGASAQALALKKAATLTGLEPAIQRRRLYGYLARRGFDLDDIRSAVAVALERLRQET